MSSAAQLLRKARDEFVLHLLQRAVAMRLEQHQQPAGKIMQRVERGGDLVGVMGEVVDHGDAVRLAHHFHAPPDSRKALQRRGRLRQRHAGRVAAADRGQRIGHIVAAGHAQA